MAADRSSSPGAQRPAPMRPAGQAWRWMSVLQTRLMDQIEADALAAGVVPFGWFEVLNALELAPGNRVRMKELIPAALLTKAGVSRMLGRIEAAGLLVREGCAGDGRGVDAVLTSAGLSALLRARAFYLEALERYLGRHLTAAQLALIASLCRDVLAANDWLPDARPVPLTIRRNPGSAKGPQ